MDNLFSSSAIGLSVVRNGCQWLQISLVVVVLGWQETASAMKRVEVDFEFVEELAKDLADQPYDEKRASASPELESLDYDAYRRISFRESESLWRRNGLPFQVQFFHQGYLFQNDVRLNEFTKTHSQQIPFVKSFFKYDSLEAEKISESSLEYAGFKVLYPLKGRGESFDEILSFLGASYFRAVGSEMHYGLSARGLAVDAGLSKPEEFPRFTEFWLGKPMGESTVMTIYALLDSPSVTGAYCFQVAPGKDMRIEVKSKLFFRSDVDSFGVAPMTSMFWYGENSSRKGVDYRPEIHDTDGLLIESKNGERLWRPLDVGESTRLSFIPMNSPSGFGLMQRDRAFASYQDLEAEYHKRPSLWIVPKGDWGRGHLKLVELPTTSEFDDNIVAFWEPAILPSKGDSLGFEYTMLWTLSPEPKLLRMPKPVSTRVGYDQSAPGDILFVIDFEAESSEAAFNPDEVPAVEAKILNQGSLSHVGVQWNPYGKTWRVTLRVHVNSDQAGPAELVCDLKYPSGRRSETWIYQWTR